jgi:hypothetical protein
MRPPSVYANCSRPTGDPCDLLTLLHGPHRVEAHTAMAENRSKECKPLPVGRPHGEPLRIGDGVAFTGCDQLTRSRLEGRAHAAGLASQAGWLTTGDTGLALMAADSRRHRRPVGLPNPDRA